MKSKSSLILILTAGLFLVGGSRFALAEVRQISSEEELKELASLWGKCELSKQGESAPCLDLLKLANQRNLFQSQSSPGECPDLNGTFAFPGYTRQWRSGSSQTFEAFEEIHRIEKDSSGIEVWIQIGTEFKGEMGTFTNILDGEVRLHEDTIKEGRLMLYSQTCFGGVLRQSVVSSLKGIAGTSAVNTTTYRFDDSGDLVRKIVSYKLGSWDLPETRNLIVGKRKRD